LERFPWGDFFNADLHEAAAFAAERTRPNDRVQLYGMAPYFLFLAKRQTATPIIYSLPLNVDAALAVGSGATLSPAQRTELLAYRDATEQFVLQRVQTDPPAAFAFFDKAPFGHPNDAEEDFVDHCPRLAAWVNEHYQPTERFGTVRIRMRR
jgi:hypothetical protein